MSDPDDRPKKVSTGRMIVWIVVGAIGLYLVVSGVLGIIAKG
jgi:hypothetical protein